MKIAILGATSHIAKGLAFSFLNEGVDDLYLYARVPEKIKSFLMQMPKAGNCHCYAINEFGREIVDVVINCIGVGAPLKAANIGRDILFITEKYDNMVLDYISCHDNCRYIHLSSGAVYGKNFANPVDNETCNHLHIDGLGPTDFYSIAKIGAEAKHRAFSEQWIVDLRVFSYFSRYIELDSGFLLTDIISSAVSKTELVTSESDIIRDFVAPRDLYALIRCCLENKKLNTGIDVYSAAPISKMKLLDWFSNEFGLKYRVDDQKEFIDPTGSKANYFSINKKARSFGYTPLDTSLDGIKTELLAMGIFKL